MFPSGAKVSPNNRLGAREYPQLTKKEYTVKFTFMTDSFTWVVLEEFPEKSFNAAAFDYEGIVNMGYAVKSSGGGYLITDLEHLNCLAVFGKVFGFKKIETKAEALEYFCTCALCDKEINPNREKYGLLKRGGLVAVPVCSKCCQGNPEIKPFFPEPLTYHDFSIDWDELEEYGEAINRPGLADEIQKEINAKCDCCEKAYSHPDCFPGECPYHLVEDYLALKHPELYDEVRKWLEAKWRLEYPDPDQQ